MKASEDKGKSLLENAYRLRTPEDNVAYYRDFSSSYDQDFAKGLGFALPRHVVDRFNQLKRSGDSPIVDLGCGTGIVGEALASTSIPVDGMDISQDMLNAAQAKNVYRALYQVDLTKTVEDHCGNYRAVLSSGTFTHGHLGPDAIDMALKLGASDCVFVLSINQKHFHALGFDAKFEALSKTGSIHDFSALEVDIYTKQDHEHSGDKALIVGFRKNA